MDISIVIPLYNEDESLPELYRWIAKVMVANNYSYEVIFVDDGSTDNSWQVITELAAAHPEVKAIKFRRNHGKSAGLNVGFEAAQGDVVFTMDADLQDSPDEIPGMRAMIVDEGYDLISGWKKKRYDPISKTIPTKLFNWATRKMSDIELHDFNCGLKAYKHDVVKNVDVHGEMHRYIPFLAKNAGFKKIGEKVVEHRARKYGTTKFGLERFVNGFLDLVTLAFISKFAKRPMHFFGLFGTLMFLIGFGAIVYIGADKLYMLSIGQKARLVTDIAWFYISLTSMILGTMLFLTGFIAELIVRNSGRKTEYTVGQRLNLD
ncbi:glycosyltransferase family 2 protein [Owenweeksia hongkongensis]|uniref:Glycosyl transferase n=1 Tax=Owenweeksia hongkongensis (strain DSM 17368 / CIP 108786 / JCM 12287 / NRRL B-23963 / UST20020801) TaxID=926562 RepID=G8R2R1_OWEHD|nr:glycosyltransferase family 2 protein [Owenweeksia hongkongensis]AEV31866.1 glycosyl transferase [Owenweeksia hongkongensis DSM 17368]